jgi:hypothetical protein
MSKHPIPNDALDDRLAFVGTSGSGKTYNTGSAVERGSWRPAQIRKTDFDLIGDKH